MAEERVIERTDASGNVTERTIERSYGERGGSGIGSTLLWLLFAALVVSAAAYFMAGMSKSESRKDEAIAAAASDIGDAAKDVGDSAKKAADELTK
jgi:hypothetical protein